MSAPSRQPLPLTWSSFVLLSVLCCSTPSPAQADTTITFNNSSLGYVTTQYQSQGVVFAVGPNGGSELPVMIKTSQSGPALNITSISQDFSATELWGQFPDTPRQNVTFVLGDYGPTTHLVELDGVDASGKVVVSAKTTVHGTAAPVKLSIHSNSANISFFHIFVPSTSTPPSDPSAYTNPFARVFVASMTFDSPAGAPDFAIIVGTIATGTIILTPGEPYPVQLTLERLFGSAGPITFAVKDLPPGISATFSPSSPETGGNGSVILMRVSAPSGTPPASGQLTLITTPSRGAGLIPHFYTIPVLIPVLDTPRVKGIEVTQGIQCFGYSAQSTPLCQSALGVPARSGFGTTVDYNGVPLVANMVTVARVFADVMGAPASGVSGFTTLLHGFDSTGKELAGSPILPAWSPPNLTDSLNPIVTNQEQLNSKAAFEFVLPWTWSQNGPISLQAELLPPVQSFSSPPVADWCSDPTNCPLSTLTLNKVNFVRLSQPGVPAWGLILPIQMTWGSSPALPPTDQVLAGVTKLTPDAILSFANYVANIDITWIVNKCPHPQPIGNTCTSISSQESHAIDKLNDWYKHQSQLPVLDGWINFYSLVLGVEKGLLPGANDLVDENSTKNSHIALAVADSNRQLTGVAHEIGHALGRQHASSCNGAANPESWPPDQQGFIQGIGLDVATSLPFTINAPGVPGEPGKWFDFMSYCANTDDSDSWISVKGWTEVLNNLSHYNGISTTGGASAPILPPSNGATLWVNAFLETDGTVEISTVGAPGNNQPPAGSPSPYSLVVRDASGAVIATVRMTAYTFHLAHGEPDATRLEAAASVEKANSVEIVRDGKVVASRTRSSVPLTLAVTKPTAGEHAEGLVVLWTMSAREGPGVEVDVDYSGDGGATWKTVYSGYDQTRVTLPNRFFTASDQARLRVRANDGFSDASAISEVFASAGAPPSVTIMRPTADSIVRTDGTLLLTGSAFDDRQLPLTGSRLQWFAISPGAQPAPLGTGTNISVTSIRADVSAIQLTATDARGRSSTATVPIAATNALQFLKLDVPKVLASTANSLSFTVRASTLGTMSVRIPGQDLSQAKTFPVDRTTRTVRLAITANRDPILLNLGLSAAGARADRAVIIPRTW